MGEITKKVSNIVNEITDPGPDDLLYLSQKVGDSYESAKAKVKNFKKVLKCSVTKTANQEVDRATHTVIVWDEAVYDNASVWAASPNPTRITAPKDGTYVVRSQAAFCGNPTGRTGISIWVNGDLESVVYHGKGNDSEDSISITKEIELSANDYVEIKVYQTTGNRSSLLGCCTRTWAIVRRVGD